MDGQGLPGRLRPNMFAWREALDSRCDDLRFHFVHAALTAGLLSFSFWVGERRSLARLPVHRTGSKAIMLYVTATSVHRSVSLSRHQSSSAWGAGAGRFQWERRSFLGYGKRPSR